jgi:hypothetical protein
LNVGPLLPLVASTSKPLYWWTVGFGGKGGLSRAKMGRN